jgi:hypothetical protein
VRVVAVAQLGQPEIRNLNETQKQRNPFIVLQTNLVTARLIMEMYHRLEVAVQEDVGRFDVPVDDPRVTFSSNRSIIHALLES